MKALPMIQSTLPLHSLLTPRKCCVKCHPSSHFKDLTKGDPLNYPGKKATFLCGEWEASQLQDGASQKCHII